MKAFPILLALYTFLAVFLGVQDVVGWREILALGPLGLAVFGFGYLIDVLIFGYLLRGTIRSHRRSIANVERQRSA
jgi:hypothetical protein